MKTFDWTKFLNRRNKIAVHCETEAEANDFCKQMHEHGLTWCDGASYLSNNAWDEYTYITAYSNCGGYTSIDYYEENNYTIYKWSDYMKKEFNKDNLKIGYLVEFRNGDKAILMPTIDKLYFDYIDCSRCLCLNDYDENLLYISNNKYDIVKVYGYTKRGYKTTLKSDDERQLLWEREDYIEVTMEEIEKKFGGKVKIVSKTN